MRQIVDKIIFGARVAVVVLAILALMVSGAGAAERLFNQRSPHESEARPDVATLDQKPDPEEATGEMATSGHPWTEQPACLQATLALPGSNGQPRSVLMASGAEFSILNVRILKSPARPSTSPNLTCPLIGHRFTLVGSKPSGTS